MLEIQKPAAERQLKETRRLSVILYYSLVPASGLLLDVIWTAKVPATSLSARRWRHEWCKPTVCVYCLFAIDIIVAQ